MKIACLGAGKRVQFLKMFTEYLHQDVTFVCYENNRDVPVSTLENVLVVESSDYTKLFPADAIIPFQGNACSFLEKNKYENSYLTQNAGIFFDKKLFHNWMVISGVDFYPFAKQGKPVVEKPRFGNGSRGINFYPDYSNILEQDEGAIYQEYIEGEEFSVDYVPGFYTVRSRIATANGEVVTSEIIKEDMSFYLEKIESIFGKFTAAVNLQFRKRDGKYYLFEINPRLGGGVTFSIAAGLPVFESILRGAGEEVKGYTNIYKPLKLQRYLSDAVFGG